MIGKFGDNANYPPAAIVHIYAQIEWPKARQTMLYVYSISCRAFQWTVFVLCIYSGA